jgi:hypothetical protein
MNLCTKDNPMPVLPLKGLTQRKEEWEHPDLVEVPIQSDNYVKHECPNCGCYWLSELAE